MGDGAAVLIQLAFGIGIGVVTALIAQSRGRSPLAWFFLGMFLPCFLGLILALALPDLKEQGHARDRLLKENMRLRERLRKDRQVADARHSELSRRVDTHDRALGLDTGQRDPLLADAGATPLIPASDSSPFVTIDWYYVQEGEARGPVRFEELRTLHDEGLIEPASLVWHDGLAEWATLDEIPGLEEDLRA